MPSEKLELLVVLDVSMTVTAEMADYILPASSQYEKWEATYFGTGMPSHHFHLRAPILQDDFLDQCLYQKSINVYYVQWVKPQKATHS